MRRKRSVQIITKLIILSLILGLCLPSFANQVNAAEFNLNYTLNYSGAKKGGWVYYANDDIEFLVAPQKSLGDLKYIVLYDNDIEYFNTDNYDYDYTVDKGFFKGINIPLMSTESDWDKYTANASKGYDNHFKGITFEQPRLIWNFSEQPASDRMYITVDATGQRIPIYFLGGYNSGTYKPEPEKVAYVTETEVEALNSSLSNLYQLVNAIETQGEVDKGKYYPEQAELLKGVACEVKQILLKSVNVPDYDGTYFFPTNSNDWNTEWSNGAYSKLMFQGMKTIVDGYVDYVNNHKVGIPTITSAKIDGKSAIIDNEKLKIIINGSAEDYKERSLEDLEVTLPEGIRGSWGENSEFGDDNLKYHVMPYNENLGTSNLEEYAALGIDYTVEFMQSYEPTITVDPAGLKGVDIKVSSNTNMSTKKTTYQIEAAAKSEEVIDAENRHYAFSHWEVDQENRDTLESATVTSDGSVKMIHGSSSSIERFVMPDNDLTITAKYEQAYRIKTESVGLQDETTFDLNSSVGALRGLNVPEKDIELFYYDYEIPSGYIVKDVQVVTVDGETVATTLTSKANTNFIQFKMPSSDVKVTVTFEKDLDNTRQLVLGEPSGMLIQGKGGTVTFELTTEGYSNDATFTATESFSTGTAVSSQTDGLTISLGNITSGKGTITVTVDPKVKAGEYYFCVTPSEGKLTAIGTVTVLSADTKVLKVENASITLKENESGEVKIKGSSMNLSAGASVEAFETDQEGQIKYSGKTEGLTFDKAVLNNDAFTLTAYVSKTVAKGEYYFIVKADNEQSAVAKLTVDREKAETPDQPDQPDQPEKETQKITVTSNASQGSIQIKVSGGSEELISGTGTVKAVEGDKVTVTAVPKDGYKLSVWKITQGMKDVALSSGSLSDTSVSFVMPAASGSDTVTVGATFDKTSTDPVVASDPKITAFSVANVSGTIDQNSGTITVVVPNGTDVTSLCPAIATSDADSVTPASGAAVDFTNAVTYTVKNASGVQKSYVVTVKVQEASVSDTLWDKITSPEGDRSWWKKADSIKSHKKSKYPKYW